MPQFRDNPVKILFQRFLVYWFLLALFLAPGKVVLVLCYESHNLLSRPGQWLHLLSLSLSLPDKASRRSRFALKGQFMF